MGKVRVLVLPGLGGSGPDHWQSRFVRENPGFRRVEQADWDRPDRDAWIATLEAAVTAGPEPAVLVAHSMACALVAHWAREGSAGRVAAAMLVAPSDVESETRVPPEVRVFAPMPADPLPFPAVVLAGRNDPYCAIERACGFAALWGADFIDAGDVGHINVASGHGPWPEGERLLKDLIRQAEG
ncbi:alpha/beta hydrolase [Azospirillum sp. TSO22-1]|uniref:RBBP9/YdeN family alpha/beta hydrolase n=1 Tax=Azospirillum sp. TSO22-1 TaxID=716789 RepID=UPI000D605C31|nr:alpha/beta hydrolase [Azospirillum sp. TSO22-1]PWC36956.1 alpha/beta hydrolase [Azospirillum sp. TSO22-1]